MAAGAGETRVGDAELDDPVSYPAAIPRVRSHRGARAEPVGARGSYGGIVKAPCSKGDTAEVEFEGGGDDPDAEDRDILLLANARDLYECPRLLDIKIGEVTAVAGWQGKVRGLCLHTMPSQWHCYDVP